MNKRTKQLKESAMTALEWLRALWILCWFVPATISLFLLCVSVAVMNLSAREGVDRWHDNFM